MRKSQRGRGKRRGGDGWTGGILCNIESGGEYAPLVDQNMDTWTGQACTDWPRG